MPPEQKWIDRQESRFQWGNLKARGNRIAGDFNLLKKMVGRCSRRAVLKTVHVAWGPHVPAGHSLEGL